MDYHRIISFNWFGNIEDTLMNSQKSLIIGMGKTGRSFAEYLLAKGLPFDFADTRNTLPNLDEFTSLYDESAFHLGELDSQLLNQYQQLLLSPGFDSRHVFIQQAKKNNLAIKGDIDLFISEVNAKVIGITGSNGKSTLTELVGYALDKLKFTSAVGGNIGTAALTLLNEDKKDIYVLELSSFQLDISTALPLDVAVILNISEDHMDRYDSFSDYVNSKLSIYDNAKIKVINLDDQHCASADYAGDEVITFSLLDAKADVYFSQEENVFYVDSKPLIDAQLFNLQGLHNYQNILAALAIAKALDINVKAFAEAALDYKGLPHRCELIDIINGVAWINDSKATNIGAASAAINSFKQPLHIIMGGQAKDADFTEFSKLLPKHVKSVILLGEDALFLQSFLKDSCDTAIVSNMKEAVALAKNNSQPGDIVLLSPACASLDMYTSYEHRGKDFKERVLEAAA